MAFFVCVNSVCGKNVVSRELAAMVQSRNGLGTNNAHVSFSFISMLTLICEAHLVIQFLGKIGKKIRYICLNIFVSNHLL